MSAQDYIRHDEEQADKEILTTPTTLSAASNAPGVPILPSPSSSSTSFSPYPARTAHVVSCNNRFVNGRADRGGIGARPGGAPARTQARVSYWQKPARAPACTPTISRNADALFSVAHLLRPSTPSTPNALERDKKHAPSPAVPLPTCRPDSGARGLRHDSETATCALWRARSAPRLGSCYMRALVCASLYGVRTDDAVPPRRLFHPRSTTYTTERDATALDHARRLHYLPACHHSC
ncbi:hypothetical protein K438DRAFT_1996851 [Mycena galopus ATCC 62051]|nr:hypothetical protein K438DRAFT_1996851 [Mycena galopus ATCC 62051]